MLATPFTLHTDSEADAVTIGFDLAQDYLVSLCDAWAKRMHAAGRYTVNAHAHVVLLVLECDDLAWRIKGSASEKAAAPLRRQRLSLVNQVIADMYLTEHCEVKPCLT